MTPPPPRLAPPALSPPLQAARARRASPPLNCVSTRLHPTLPAGRKGKTGIATTFINKNQSEHILLDLKHLLKEAKQRLPPVLQALHDPMEELAVRCWRCCGCWAGAWVLSCCAGQGAELSGRC